MASFDAQINSGQYFLTESGNRLCFLTLCEVTGNPFYKNLLQAQTWFSWEKWLYTFQTDPYFILATCTSKLYLRKTFLCLLFFYISNFELRLISCQSKRWKHIFYLKRNAKASKNVCVLTLFLSTFFLLSSTNVSGWEIKFSLLRVLM